MPHLVRFLLRHAVIGFGVALVFVAILLALDAHGLRTLMMRGPDGWLAAGVLAFAMGLTFGSVQMGVAVMLLTARDEGGGGRRRPSGDQPEAARFAPALVPVPRALRSPRG